MTLLASLSIVAILLLTLALVTAVKREQTIAVSAHMKQLKRQFQEDPGLVDDLKRRLR